MGAEAKVVDIFSRFARCTERQTGRPHTFVAAVGLIIIWGVTGPLFGWSDTWQLVINTGTTIVTFLMVFLIQHTQTRDTQAIQLKLDELIRVNKQARNNLMNLEDMPEEELEHLKDAFGSLAEKRAHAREEIEEAEDAIGKAREAIAAAAQTRKHGK
jgi:low affinity Fe/Cu permease